MPPLRAKISRTRPGPYNLRRTVINISGEKPPEIIDISGEYPPDIPVEMWTKIAENLDLGYLGAFKMVSVKHRDAVFPITVKLNMPPPPIPANDEDPPPLIIPTAAELKKTPIAAKGFLRSEDGAKFVIENWPDSYYAALVNFEDGDLYDKNYWPAFFCTRLNDINEIAVMDFARFGHLKNFKRAVKWISEHYSLRDVRFQRAIFIRELMGIPDVRFIKEFYTAVICDYDNRIPWSLFTVWLECAVEKHCIKILTSLLSQFASMMTDWNIRYTVNKIAARGPGDQVIEKLLAQYIPDDKVYLAKYWAIQSKNLPLYEELLRRDRTPIITDAEMEQFGLSYYIPYMRALEKYAENREKYGYAK